MYLRHAIRKKGGKVHRYWCLVRSVRVGRRVVQQVVAHLGELDEQGRIEARALARQIAPTIWRGCAKRVGVTSSARRSRNLKSSLLNFLPHTTGAPSIRA